MLRMLLAALALAFGSVTAQAGDTTPYTVVSLGGGGNGTMDAPAYDGPNSHPSPRQLPYPAGHFPFFNGSYPKGSFDFPEAYLPPSTTWTAIALRPSAPSINKSWIYSIGGPPSVYEQGTATLTISYNATNNQTTYKIQNATVVSQSTVPLDLRCVLDIVSKGFLANVGALVDNTGTAIVGKSIDSSGNPIYYPFSGSVNGVSYQGQVGLIFYNSNREQFYCTNYADCAHNTVPYPTTVYYPGYEFFDADGTFLMAVEANTSGGLAVHMPGDGIQAPAGHPASTKVGTGTFTQTTDGITVNATFPPTNIITVQKTATATDSDPYFWNN